MSGIRTGLQKSRQRDSRIEYRGENPSRLDNLTDAVFGIAITLLIFNLTNPNSFSDLLTFTKTLPAFVISISFVILIWVEHWRFSEIYSLDDSRLLILNTVFIALVIFYVYPLRFLTLFLTNFFFQAGIDVSIYGHEVPYLMVYYGSIVGALYGVLYLFYRRAGSLVDTLKLNAFEQFYTKMQKRRLLIMFTVPLISIASTIALYPFSYLWSSVIGGVMYCMYTPLMIFWHRSFKSKSLEYSDV